MARLHEERRHLAAMVRLMIGEVRDDVPERQLLDDAAPEIAQGSRQLLGRERRDERVDLVVGLRALAAQLAEGGVELLISLVLRVRELLRDRVELAPRASSEKMYYGH